MLLRGEAVVAEILPDFGMSIVSLRDGSGHEQLWQRPDFTPPRRTRDIGPPGEPSIEAMFALWPGGWFEMSPHAGMPGLLDGRETMLHGEAARLAWEVIEESSTHIEAQADCVHEPLRLRRRIELDGDGLRLRSWIENRGTEPVEVCHGEHPVFSRPDYAGAQIELQARSARVLDQAEPQAATALPGEFEWPHAPAVGGGTVDLSVIPDEPGAHDHVTIELADPLMRIVRPDRTELQIDAGDHRHALLWRYHQPPTEPDPRDIWALEPWSFSGVSIPEAIGATERVAPTETITYTSRITTC